MHPRSACEHEHMELVCVTIDCHGPERVARFWNDTLRWGGITVSSDGGRAVCRPRGGDMYLEFVRVPEQKVIKNRVHLGLNAGSLVDLDEEIERLLRLGASLAWEEEFPTELPASYRNVVLRDPEGNEFCLGGGAFPE